jgi:cell wall-associated NlpC family hydrolase
MRRPALAAACLAALAAALPAHATEPAPPAGAAPRPGATPSWARVHIAAVTARGLMGGDPAAFRPDDPLTQGELEELVAGLTGAAVRAPANPHARVTVAGLDARLVRAVGLGPAARAFAAAAAGAGLRPPSRFGTEVAARLLGLRTNHPAAQDSLELLPGDPVTRAEAAFSAARVLALRPLDVAAVAGEASAFALPALDLWQQRILTTALGLVGLPYVWGGTSERPHTPSGVPVRGGFDCSGFVWRVYKLQAYPGGAALPATLRGRTTYAMSGEVPAAKRVARTRLAPGDLVFFGARGARSRPAEVDHMGIYVTDGWFVHSSSRGVALARLAGWYEQRFAWGRRPLAEAGLAPAAG